MHGDGVVDRREVEAVGYEFKYEFDWLVHVYTLDSVTHTIEARRLVAKHRVFAIVRRLEESLFEFCRLLVGEFGHTFAFPYRATTEIAHILRENDFEACFFE